jgi:hypothetical protein
MFQSCRHILGAGTQCAAPALRSEFFCRHHNKLHVYRHSSGLRSQIRTQIPTQTYDNGTIPVPAREIHPPLELEFPEDRASIQINLYRIADALARNRMDRPTATALMYAMQVCQTNLGKRPLIEPAIRPQSRLDDEDSAQTAPAPPRPVSRVILTPDGDEIAPPVEILEEDEAEPIHHRLCPCLLCAEKHRDWPGEEHHPACQCGLCEEQGTEHRAQSTESADLSTELGSPEPCILRSEPCALSPVPRIARAAALLSGSTQRDPLNRPWSVAEYTFGDAIRRHEAQYAARAAAALAEGIEPPPYQPYVTGLIAPGTPEYAEDQQMQQQTSEYWAAHFRAQIAERPDLQRALAEEAAEEENEEPQATEITEP